MRLQEVSRLPTELEGRIGDCGKSHTHMKLGKRLHKVSHLPTDLVREMRLHKVSCLSPSDETLNRGLPCAYTRKKITHAH